MLIDAGNSRLKWVIWQADQCAWSSVSYASYNVSTRVAVTLELLGSVKPTFIMITHVLGASFEAEIRAFCTNYNINLTVIRSQSLGYGIKNAYDNAQKLGADRFVALVAVHYQNQYKDDFEYGVKSEGRNSIIVSCGTAVTIDALNQHGEHLGGVILPGLQLWRDMLIKGTTLLEQTDECDSSVFATSTEQGIAAGSLYGLAGAIDRICNEMKHLLVNSLETSIKESCITIVLTGGCAEFLLPYLHHTYHLRPNLVIQGLKIINEIDNA